MKETEMLKNELERLSSELNHISIKEAASALGIKHVNSNDVRVMAANFIRRHPEYKFVLIVDKNCQRCYSAFENGCLTCCEFEEESNA